MRVVEQLCGQQQHVFQETNKQTVKQTNKQMNSAIAYSRRCELHMAVMYSCLTNRVIAHNNRLGTYAISLQ